jgi:hypothetical protein
MVFRSALFDATQDRVDRFGAVIGAALWFSRNASVGTTLTSWLKAPRFILRHDRVGQ